MLLAPLFFFVKKKEEVLESGCSGAVDGESDVIALILLRKQAPPFLRIAFFFPFVVEDIDGDSAVGEGQKKDSKPKKLPMEPFSR